MKLGVVFSAFYPASLAEMGVTGAESVGADSLWTFDHMLGVFHPEVYDEVPFSELVSDPDGLFDPFCLCATVGRTTELPLGMAVTDSIRCSAPDVARTALTLQHLCKGGFNLGVGCGEAENLTPFGYSFDRPVATTERFLQTLRHLLDSGRMPDGPGRLGLPLRSDKGAPKVWLASHGPRMLRLAGEYADGWLPVAVREPHEYRRMKSVIAEHAAAAGRPEPESGLFTFCLLGESRDRIREMFEDQPMGKLLALWLAPPAAWRKHGLEHPVGEDHRAYVDVIPHTFDPARLRELAPRIPFELLEEAYLHAGNAGEVMQQLSGFAEAGCEHFIVWNFTGLVGGMAEVIARASEWSALCQAIRIMGKREILAA
jgi:phthiodiolone/phenolphthiodiolone dimycocerosates ketoreductase